MNKPDMSSWYFLGIMEMLIGLAYNAWFDGGLMLFGCGVGVASVAFAETHDITPTKKQTDQLFANLGWIYRELVAPLAVGIVALGIFSIVGMAVTQVAVPLQDALALLVGLCMIWWLGWLLLMSWGKR